MIQCPRRKSSPLNFFTINKVKVGRNKGAKLQYATYTDIEHKWNRATNLERDREEKLYHSAACLILELGRNDLFPDMLGFKSPTVITPITSNKFKKGKTLAIIRAQNSHR